MKILSIFRAVPACLLAAILTGCVGGSVDSAHQAGAKRIGVISLLGDRTQGQVPTMLFSREIHGTSVDFNLDATACAHAVDRLHAAHPNSAVVNLQAERGSVRLHVPGHRPDLFNTGEYKTYVNDLNDAAHQLTARHALNLVVLIVPWGGTNANSQQVPNEPGYGISTRSILGVGFGDEGVFANFCVLAFDGATGQQLAAKIASVNKMVDEVPQRSSLDAYSPEQRAKVAEALREMVLKGLDEQLAHMHLAPDE